MNGRRFFLAAAVFWTSAAAAAAPSGDAPAGIAAAPAAGAKTAVASPAPAVSVPLPTTVRIATEGAYPPFNYVENNEAAGFEVDLGKALCVAMKVTCSIVLQDWDGMISGLKEHRYDAIMSSMEITPERKQRIAFSRRYYQIPSTLIGPSADTAKTGAGAPDLAGKSVGTTADSPFATYLEEAPSRPELKPYDKLEEAELDLLTGRIDYVLGDALAIRAFLDSREGKTCCRWVANLPVDRGEGIGVGLRKTDIALRDAFDAAIGTVEKDGTYDRIREKYIPFDVK